MLRYQRVGTIFSVHFSLFSVLMLNFSVLIMWIYENYKIVRAVLFYIFLYILIEIYCDGVKFGPPDRYSEVNPDFSSFF